MADFCEINFMKGIIILVKLDKMYNEQSCCWSQPFNIRAFTTIPPLLKDSFHLLATTSYYFLYNIQIINVI